MKLKIENWSDNLNPFDSESLDLFNESVTCYKVGAYRSAFLMSYLAFLSTIKNRIANYGRVPENYGERSWDELKKSLENDNSWEKALLGALLISPPTKQKPIDRRIFKIKNHAQFVDEMEVYRHKRNVCAHNKNSTIDASTVECLWNFMQDNLFAIQVGGGIDYWVDTIFKAYRDKNEYSDIHYELYVDSLRFSQLDKQQLIELWGNINEQINRLRNLKAEQRKEFWRSVFFHRTDYIRDSSLEYAQKDGYLFFSFYKLIPEILNQIMNSKDGIEFKKDKLIPWINKCYRIDDLDKSYWDLIINLVKYIPNDEKDCFLEQLSFKALIVEPTEEQCQVLKEMKFFELKKQEIKHYIIYSYDNAGEQLEYINATFIVLKYATIDKDLAIRLNSYMDGLVTHHYPWINELYYKFKDFINSTILDKITNVALINNINLCDCILNLIKEGDLFIKYDLLKLITALRKENIYEFNNDDIEKAEKALNRLREYISDITQIRNQDFDIERIISLLDVANEFIRRLRESLNNKTDFYTLLNESKETFENAYNMVISNIC